MMRPAEPIRIVIHPSGADSDALTIADAMQQVLDMFELLSKAEATNEDSEATVVWQLVSASTNSPFTVEAMPISSNPEMAVDRQAIQAAIDWVDGMEHVLKAESKASWIDERAEPILKRILLRNLNGIGRTDISISSDKPSTIIDHRSARRGQNFLERMAAEAALMVEDLTRKEYGSVEGHVSGTTTWYGRPAFVMRARLSGDEIKCVLSPMAIETIGTEHNWKESWTGSRVLVTGVCHYDDKGRIKRIDAEQLTKIISKSVEISDLRDSSFSNGQSPAEHARKAWGDDNG